MLSVSPPPSASTAMFAAPRNAPARNNLVNKWSSRFGHHVSPSESSIMTISLPFAPGESTPRTSSFGPTIVRTPYEALAGLRARSPDAHDLEYKPHIGLRARSPDARNMDYNDQPGLRDSTPPPPPAKTDTERKLARPKGITIRDLPPPSAAESVAASSPPPSPVSPSSYTSPPPPPFKAVLLSEVPEKLLDREQLVIALETATSCMRTTLATLTSRASHLARYLDKLVPLDSHRQSVPVDEDDEASTPISALYNMHLASQGLLTEASQALHVFLDRPSEPYYHILAYLRCPTEFLPHAVRVPSPNSRDFAARVDALVELRDEAIFLGITELSRLCSDELSRVRQSTQIRPKSAPHTTLHKAVEATSPRPPVPRGLPSQPRLGYI